MSKSRKVQLEKKIMIFLSSGVFIFSGLYASNVQAAPVFSSGSASDSTVAGVNNTASANSSSAFGYFNECMGILSIRSINKELYSGKFKVLDIKDLVMFREFVMWHTHSCRDTD